MTNEEGKRGIILYADYEEKFSMLPDEDKAGLVMAMFAYNRTGVVPEGLSPMVQLIMSFIKGDMDRNREKYAETCKRNRENGKKGGRPQKQVSESNTPNVVEEYTENRENPAEVVDMPTENGGNLPEVVDMPTEYRDDWMEMADSPPFAPMDMPEVWDDAMAMMGEPPLGSTMPENNPVGFLGFSEKPTETQRNPEKPNEKYKEKEKENPKESESVYKKGMITPAWDTHTPVQGQAYPLQAQPWQGSRPSLQQVTAYCREKQLTVDPQTFFHYYSSTGWTANGKPIADWQAKLRYWDAKDRQNGKTTAPIPTNPARYPAVESYDPLAEVEHLITRIG